MGQLKSSVTCTFCGFTSTVFEPFWDLSIPLAQVSSAPAPVSCSGRRQKLLVSDRDLPSSQKTSGEVTLDDCLRLFTQEDMLDGEERPVRSLQRRVASAPVDRVTDYRFCLSDVLQVQKQKEMHQTLEHPEVPSHPRAAYPHLKRDRV